jgi:hypothetical protein
MNAKKLLIASLVAVAPAAAFADNPSELIFNFNDPAPTKTRAEVIAGYHAAVASGEYVRLNKNRPTFEWAAPTKTRAEVKAELAQAQERGEVIHNDADVYFAKQQVGSTTASIDKE